MARRGVIVALLGGLAVLGAAGLIAMALNPAEHRAQWGYVAATAVFILSACQTAPALALATRIGRGYWGAPLRRVADVLALAGAVNSVVLLVLLLQLPDWLGRPSIWFDWPGAPQVWDGVAIIGLAATGAALTLLTTRTSKPRGLQQWAALQSGLVILGAFYTMLLVFVHLLVASDMALSLVPGWHSAVIPPYQVVSGVEAALALVIIVMPRTPQRLDTLHSAAKLLLALGLLWFYFTWCEFLTYWYGRTPDEQALLSLFMFGPGAGLFLVAVVCEFVVPLSILMWNSARTSPAAITTVAAIVLTGSFADRLRMYVGAWSVATPHYEEHLPDQLQPLPWPGPIELVACAGILAATALVLWIALRYFGAISDAEVKAVERLTPQRRLVRARVQVVGRPT